MCVKNSLKIDSGPCLDPNVVCRILKKLYNKYKNICKSDDMYETIDRKLQNSTHSNSNYIQIDEKQRNSCKLYRIIVN